MVVKIVGAIIVVFASYMVGEMMYIRAKDGVEILREFRKLGTLYRAQIRYVTGDIVYVFQSIRDKVGSELSALIDSMVKLLGSREYISIGQMWEGVVMTYLDKSGLSKEEESIIRRFGDVMGLADKELQIENATQYIEELDDMIKLRERELKVKNRMYRTVSIATGLALVLIVI